MKRRLSSKYRLTLAALGKNVKGYFERQGFYWLLGLCILIILCTALWTRSLQQQTITPPPDEPAADALVQQDESLAQATVSPTPIPAPDFIRPLAEKDILRGFDGSRPQLLAAHGIWRLHTACDYRGAQGAPVYAVLDGTVTAVTESQAEGVTVTLTHGGGFVSLYGGMMSAAGLRASDPVRRGQIVGTLGLGPLLEQADGPHLHFQLLKDGIAVNPEDWLPAL